jgi:hypothetical protein
MMQAKSTMENAMTDACRDTPDRECMLRRLYAQRHGQPERCGRCERAQAIIEAASAKVAAAQEPAPKAAPAPDWRPIPAFPGYEINKRGRVRNANGYVITPRGRRIGLTRDKCNYMLPIADLVAMAWEEAC